MSRARGRTVITDRSRGVVPGATVYVYEPDTTTPIAETIYADYSGATTLANPLTADERGGVLFYLTVPKRVDLKVEAAGYTAVTIPDFPVMNPDTGGVTDHGALTGLADDDHTQYHTDARGDARYSVLAHAHDTDTLVANAVTQRPALAVGVTSGPTTASTTYVDLTDMAITLTTEGGDLDVDFSGTFAGDAVGGNAVFTALSLDGAAEVAERGHVYAAGYQHTHAISYRFSGLPAGVHTVKVRWRVTAGAGATATLTRRALRVTEVRR